MILFNRDTNNFPFSTYIRGLTYFRLNFVSSIAFEDFYFSDIKETE